MPPLIGCRRTDRQMTQGLDELLATLPQVGTLCLIGLRPARRAPLQCLASAEVSANGLVGDRAAASGGGGRQVTLIQAEHLPVIASLLGRHELDPVVLRRNLVVSGINLLALVAAEFVVGSVRLAGTGRCHPCSRMEQALGPGGYNAMRGHGGITARVLEPGIVAVGDPVRLVRAGALSAAERR
jgi:MOSC domain-containing protein YiiM